MEDEEAEPESVQYNVGVEVEASTGEQVEQDTQESEDVLDLTRLLLPDASFPANADQFGVLYNRKLLDGWVKQPSACCGAAVVAGALNCLGAMHRKHSCSLTHIDILNVYRTLLSNSIAKKTLSFERCLGASVGVFLCHLEADMFLCNAEQGRKKYSISRKEVMCSLRRLITADQKERNTVNGGEEGASRAEEAVQLSAACDLLEELLANDEKAKEEEEEKEDTSAGAGAGAGEVQCDSERLITSVESEVNIDTEEMNQDPRSGPPPAIIVIPGRKAKAGMRRPKKSVTQRLGQSNAKRAGEDGGEAVEHNTWQWMTALCEIMKKTAGLRKLQADKPSTACIGNWGILAGLPLLLQTTEVPPSTVSARLFMGKGISGPRAKVEVPLSRKDTAQKITAQWSALRSAFADPDQVLVFHLKNHYALVFAVREWSVREEGDAGGGDSSQHCLRTVRQLFTARRGQRPAVWVDFAEARETMLGWEGYKVMSLQREEGSDAVKSLQSIKAQLQQHYPEEDETALNEADRKMD